MGSPRPGFRLLRRDRGGAILDGVLTWDDLLPVTAESKLSRIRPAWGTNIQTGLARHCQRLMDALRLHAISRTLSARTSAVLSAVLTTSHSAPTGRKMTPPAVMPRFWSRLIACNEPGIEYGVEAAARAAKTSPATGISSMVPAST